MCSSWLRPVQCLTHTSNRTCCGCSLPPPTVPRVSHKYDSRMLASRFMSGALRALALHTLLYARSHTTPSLVTLTQS